MSSNTKELMIRAAWMYYDDNLTHEQIAKKLHLSRVKVTRLLQRAREEGVVEINVAYPLPFNYQLGKRVEAQFGIDEAIIVNTGDTESDTLHEIGRATAETLMHSIEKGCRVGFGWSSTVSQMSAFLKAPPTPIEFSVADLVGSMLGRSNPYSVSGKVAEICSAPLYPLSVPAVVRNEAAYRAIMSDLNVQQTFQMARKSDLGFVGVGNMGVQSTLVQSNYLTPEEMEEIHQQGAVGDVLMRYYDIHGNLIPTVMDDFVIGLSWEDIQRIPRLVVAAFGERKIEPIIGILRSGLCNVLITDVSTAEEILDAVQDI